MDNRRYLLSLMNLFGYLNASPTSRCISEGESIVNARHIIACGILDKTVTSIKIFALCLKTSGLTEKPHEINAIFSIMNGVLLVSEAVCSCKAGLSKRCKHVAAVLILSTRENVLGFPTISSTDTKCYWTKVKATEMYKPAPVNAHKCFVIKAASGVKLAKSLDIKAILTTCAEDLPDSAFAKHRIGRRLNTDLNEQVSVASSDQHLVDILLESASNSNLLNSLEPFSLENDCCKKTYERICNVDVAAVEKEAKNFQPMWFKERQFRVTGSRCYALFTYSLNEWEMKAKKYFWPKSFKNKYTEHGHEFESVARNSYKIRNGYRVVEPGLIICRQHKWLAYSPDGIVFRGNIPSKLLEIKCPYQGKTVSAVRLIDSCKFLKLEDEHLILNKKHSYYAQVQLGMAILNLQECDFIVYASFDDSFLNVIVKYDESFTKRLIQKLQYNYFNKMIHVLCN